MCLKAAPLGLGQLLPCPAPALQTLADILRREGMRDKQWMQGEGEGRGSSRSFKSNLSLWVSSGRGRKLHTLFTPKTLKGSWRGEKYLKGKVESPP